MRVLLLNQFGAASGAPTGRILGELADALRKRGHDAHLIATSAPYGKPRRGVKRLVEEIMAHVHLFAGSMGHGKVDAVISLTSPACLAVTAGVAAKILGARHFHWAMDLYPDVGVRLGQLKEGAMVRFFSALMQRAYQQAYRVVALDEDMRDYLRKNYQVDSAVIEPPSPHVTWSPVPVAAEKKKQWLYSGNFGRAHEIGILLQAQKNLEDTQLDAELVLQGNGPQFEDSRAEAARLGLRNVQWRGPVSQEQLGECLLQADVLVVTRKANLKGLLLPSKLILARLSGRSILWIGDTDGHTARSLAAQGHGVFTAGDVDAIAVWLRKTMQPGSTGEKTAPQSTEKAQEQNVDQWEKLLADAVPK